MACAVTSAGGGDRGAVCPPIRGIRSTPVARVTTLIEVATGRQIARRGRIRGQQRRGDIRQGRRVTSRRQSTPGIAGESTRGARRRRSHFQQPAGFLAGEPSRSTPVPSCFIHPSTDRSGPRGMATLLHRAPSCRARSGSPRL